MSDTFLGAIRLFSFPFAPKGWALCNGQTLPINQNQALFSLMGTTYGGDGRTTFALPNLQGRVPISFGNSFVQGQVGGEAAHTLTLPEMPTHAHGLQASPAAGTSNIPDSGSVLSRRAAEIYHTYSNPAPLVNTTLGIAGSSQPHTNLQPYLVMNYCIALVGIFPSRN